MDKEHLFTTMRARILKTPAYQGIPSFPDAIHHIKSLEDLVWWLGTTNFSASRTGGDYVATSELGILLYNLDSSTAALLRLIAWVNNQETPGLFKADSLGEQKEYLSHYSLTDAIQHLVMRRPQRRKRVAQWIIFEYDISDAASLTLAQCALKVGKEYQWEFGQKAYLSSTRDVTSVMQKNLGTEREQLHRALVLALEIGTGHIRSRLAMNWLASVQLHDPSVQQELEVYRGMTMKQIWQRQMLSSMEVSDAP
jgi:hypothetical protein